jgi:hypothetical protein
LGIGLYFSTLRAIAFITLIAGCLSIPNILYFNSDEYMPPQFKTSLTRLVKGSALCLNNPWVPCLDCNCTDKVEWEQGDRCGYIIDEEGIEQAFAKRNACNAPTKQNGMFNYATMLLFLVSTVLLSEFLQRQEVKFDEDEQTAQDYSVVITNPPDDAKNPEEWRRFFKDKLGATVTVCTCALDNDLLVRTLQERREKFQMLKNMLKPGTSTNLLHIAKLAAKEERSRSAIGRWMASFSAGIPELFARIVTLNSKVQGLAQLSYPCTNVFVTFETEKDQRMVLSQLSVSYFAAGRNDKSALASPDYLFRGETVLAISEPEEPNTIRWQDLNTTFKDRMRQQGLTLFATLTAIVVVGLVVYIVNETDAVLAAFVISGANSIFPMFAKALVSILMWKKSLLGIERPCWSPLLFILSMNTSLSPTRYAYRPIWKPTLPKDTSRRLCTSRLLFFAGSTRPLLSRLSSRLRLP